ncbi:MAG: hypothetical protein KJ737_07120 [Proteobacteria bacterium]|nr:hypothetical protein [Pseudomonadota bacterium]
MKIEEIKRLQDQFTKELAGVSQDLKLEIQQKQKAEIRQKYSKPMAEAQMELKSEADRIESEIVRLSDPVSALTQASFSQASREVSPGDMAMVSIIGNLPKEALKALVGHPVNPVVRLAALGRSHSLDDFDLKADILSGVQLPEADIKHLRNQAVEIYQTVLSGASLKPGGMLPDEKMTIGRQIQAHSSKI